MQIGPAHHPVPSLENSFENCSATGVCQRYQATIILTMIPTPPQSNDQRKSIAAAETLGISITNPAKAATIASRLAQLYMRSNPQPIKDAIPATNRNIYGPASSSPFSNGAPSAIEIAPGEASMMPASAHK